MDHQAFAQLLGNYGEFVGAIAVVVTLIYLAVQIRQNSAQLKINSYQTSVDRHHDQIANVTEDPAKFEMFRIGLANYDELRPEQQAMFHSQMLRSFSVYQVNMQLVDAGVLPEAEAAGQRLDLARILSCPGVNQWASSLNLEPGARTEFDAIFNAIRDVGEPVTPLNEALSFLTVDVAHQTQS